MTVQVSSGPQGTPQVFTFDPAGTPPMVPLGPPPMQFQDLRPDGSLGPVWGAEDMTFEKSSGERNQSLKSSLENQIQLM